MYSLLKLLRSFVYQGQVPLGFVYSCANRNNAGVHGPILCTKFRICDFDAQPEVGNSLWFTSNVRCCGKRSVCMGLSVSSLYLSNLYLCLCKSFSSTCTFCKFSISKTPCCKNNTNTTTCGKSKQQACTVQRVLAMSHVPFSIQFV